MLFVTMLLILLLINQKHSVSNFGQADSIAVMQTNVLATESQNQYAEYEVDQIKVLLQYGWAFAQTEMSLRDAIWRLCVNILPENGYMHVANAIPLVTENSGYKTKIIAEEEAYYASALISDIWKHSFEKVGNLTLSEDVQVILYHTHNAETYLPDDGVSKVSGQNGGVVDAARVFQNALQKKYGLRTAHSTTIHDYPDWSRSYQNSLNTAKQLLQAYPEAKAIFDIHRDAGFTSKKTHTSSVI